MKNVPTEKQIHSYSPPLEQDLPGRAHTMSLGEVPNLGRCLRSVTPRGQNSFFPLSSIGRRNVFQPCLLSVPSELLVVCRRWGINIALEIPGLVECPMVTVQDDNPLALTQDLWLIRQPSLPWGVSAHTSLCGYSTHLGSPDNSEMWKGSQ